MAPAGGLCQGGQTLQRLRVRTEAHGVDHDAGAVDPLQQVLIGHSGVGIVLHRVGEHHQAPQLAALPGQTVQVVQGRADGTVEAVTVSSMGTASTAPARASAATSSSSRVNWSPKEARAKRVFSPQAAARRSAKAETSSRKGGMELELSTSSSHVTGNPACRTVSSVPEAGEGPAGDLRVRLGDGRLRAVDVHIGIERVPVHKGPLDGGGGRRPGAHGQGQGQAQSQAQGSQSFHPHSSKKTAISEKLSFSGGVRRMCRRSMDSAHASGEDDLHRSACISSV